MLFENKISLTVEKCENKSILPDPLLERREALPLRDLDLLPRELRLPDLERPVRKIKNSLR